MNRLRERLTVLLPLLLLGAAGAPIAMAESDKDDAVLEISHTSDFEITGVGTAEQWTRTSWVTIPARKKGSVDLSTRAKVLYSDKGIYFLIECEDTKMTASLAADFEDLWNEDVVEVFLKPEEDFPVYFEYELSPLGHELPIMVPNNKGKFFGWRPWHYDGERKIKKAVLVFGGESKEKGAKIEGWRAEFFIPFDLLKPLGNVPPKPGTKWRGNIYRIDYDEGKAARWEWQPVGLSFHEYEKFGTFLFR